MVHYDLVIFDFDGTLLKTDEAIAFCMLQTLRQMNIPYKEGVETQIRELIGTGTTLEATFRTLGVQINNLHECMDRYRAIYASKAEGLCSLYDGVETTLQRLQQQRIPTALLSNKGHTAVERAVQHYNLDNYLQFVGGEKQGVKPKPDPTFFNTVVAPQFQLTPDSNVLMVGDTVADIQFARAIAADACWVSYGFGNNAACEALSPEFTIHQLSDVIGIVIEIDRSRDIQP